MTGPIVAVRLIIPDAEGRVLIVQREQRSTRGGSWCLPGGKVDYGVPVETTVAKELEEETSLACTALEFLFYQDSLPQTPEELHCVNLYFECRAEGEIRLNEESEQFAWIGPDDLSRYQIVFRNDLALKRYWGLKG